jgi:uncharacterized protein (TIGR02186 family)
MRLAVPVLAAALAAALVAPARAERIIVTLSSDRVHITSTYTGSELVVFGVIERDANSGPRVEPYDVVVTSVGPSVRAVVRQKERVGPVWVNLNQRKFFDVPSVIAVQGSRPLPEMTTIEYRRRFRLGIEALVEDTATDAPDATFRDALIRLKKETGLYREDGDAVRFLTPTVFRAAVPVPATAPVGRYAVDISLLAGGVQVARADTAFFVDKAGFEALVVRQARRNPVLYGVATAAMALAFGWLASIIFRRD